jgi:hypothetical protein
MSEKFFKIRLLKQCLDESREAKELLFTELVANATNSECFKKQFETFKYLSLRESTLIEKILAFETEDISDYEIQSFQFDQIVKT